MKTNHGVASATARASRVRYFRRAQKPASLWPWGWLPLLGLAITFAYGLFVTTPEIQAHTVAGVTEQLKADGIAVLAVKTAGQRVMVRADVRTDKRRLRNSAGSATCRTWLGDAVCPTRIDIEVATNSARGSEAGGAASMARGDAGGKPHRFNFKTRDRAAVLRGEVPTEAVRRALVLEATTLFDEVSDRMTVTKDAPDAAFDWARDRILRVLAALHSGQVIWQGGKLSVRGVADANNQIIIRNALTSGPDARPGKIHLDPLMTATTCNAQFAALFGEGALRFARGSSTLLPESAPVIEQVATLARDCRQPLIIAGHTDSRGRSQANLELSLARAESVKTELIAKGVAGSRLTARGYGDAEPIADNATEAGRAANRRIEIRVVQVDTGDQPDDGATATIADRSRQSAAQPQPAAADCSAQFEALLDANALRFARGSSTLLAESAPLLERVAQLARECRQPLVISGHTDSRGQPQDNRDLSLARAESVKTELIARGIEASRLTTRGFGDTRPVDDNATEAGRAANRRIEILTMERR